MEVVNDMYVKYQNGFSFIELAVSLVLTGIIFTVLVQYFLNNKLEYKRSLMLLDKEQEILLTIEVIRDSIRKAGFTPCGNLQSLKIYHDFPNLYNQDIYLGDNKDGLNIRRMDDNFAVINNIIGFNKILFFPVFEFNIKDYIVITDCVHSEIHLVKDSYLTSQGRLIVLNSPLKFEYGDNGAIYIGKLIEESFFVHRNKNNQLALFYKNVHSEELSSFIHKITPKILLNNNKLVIYVDFTIDDNRVINTKTVVRVS